MPLPMTYRKGVTPPIASYDFFDIAEGTGVVEFFGAEVETHGGADYVLTHSEIYAEGILTDGVLPGTFAAAVFNQDFDISFNIPKIIKGTALFNIPVGIYQTNANAGEIYATIDIKKVSGAVSSTLASVQSSTWTGEGGAGGTTQHYLSFPATISKTKFKRYDTLRLTIKLYSRVTAGSGRWAIWHDPKGRNDTLNATWTSVSNFMSGVLSAYIPFVIDL